MSPKQIIHDIIKNNLYLSLATNDGKKPWNTPLFYGVNNKLIFFFVSEKSSLHVRNIKKNSLVALTIFDSHISPETVNGLQIEANAYEVSQKDAPSVAKVIYKKRFPGLSVSKLEKYVKHTRYMGKSDYRLYKIIPNHFYILDPTRTSKHKRDVRIEVKI